MSEIEDFLATAVRLEREAAERYEELADAIAGYGQTDVVEFFRQQALFSRRHLQQAEARTGFRENWTGQPGIDSEKPAAKGQVTFPAGESPEAAAIWAADATISLEDAMKVALAAEEAGYHFYADRAEHSADPEVRTLAAEFEEEEAGHVKALKELIARKLKG